MWPHFVLSRNFLQFKVRTVKEWTCAGSEKFAFVSTFIHNHATGSAMHNTSALQEERMGGHAWHTCTLRVILPKQEVMIGISVYMFLNKDGHKAPS